jgi:hypothetical protein
MSQKKIRSYLSKVIDTTGNVFANIAKKMGLDFKCEKPNTDYTEFGGGNKTCTLKIWYDSEILKRRSFLKVQINFVESMCFPFKKGQLIGLLTGKHEELNALFPEYAEYAQKIPFIIYDIARALQSTSIATMTRKNTWRWCWTRLNS